MLLRVHPNYLQSHLLQGFGYFGQLVVNKNLTPAV